MRTINFTKQLSRLNIASAILLSLIIGSLFFAPSNLYMVKGMEAVCIADNSLAEAVPYMQYIDKYKEAPYPNQKIILTGETAVIESNGGISKFEGYEGFDGTAVYTEETSKITWNINVSQAGLYVILFEYYPVPGSGGTIERSFYIDQKLPFSEADRLSFCRFWSNTENEIEYDTQGNQIMIEQTEVPQWIKQYAVDPSGIWQGPLQIYLSEGSHTVSIEGVMEPMVIGSVSLEPAGDMIIQPYENVYADYPQKKRVSSDVSIVLQGEDANIKSSQMLFPLSDKTSPTVEPYSPTKIVYNTIGGNQWTNVGQWAQWDFYVPQDGLYALSSHFKQALKNERASVREIQIDGKIPFNEAYNWKFPYSSVWQTQWFASDDGVPYEFYLTKGWHTLKINVSLGEYAEIISLSTQYLNELNSIYRSIIAISGVNPDQYRDYKFDEMIPDVIVQMSEISKKLKSLEQSVAYIDNNSETIADIKRIYVQLDLMLSDTDTIAARLTNFKDNIASFGTWINTQRGQPLEIDWLKFTSAETSLAQGEANFFALALHYIKGFIYSFIADYETIGQTEIVADTSIKVWMTTSQDQAQILRQIIRSNFTPDSNIAAEVQLVSTRALLPAILAGKGPDVSLGMLSADINNLALRGAIYDLTEFDEISEVCKEFYDYAVNTFRFKDSIYALPETQTWAMLFYRKDILEELDISLNELNTWDSILYSVLPKLKKSSLSFGILPTIQNYLSFLYQYNGQLYSDDGKRSGLSDSEAIESMKLFTMLYKQYGVPISFDFANRFRTGEMPLAVTEFTSYNTLTLFASEIKGLWGILPVPGTVQNDGAVSHRSVATVNGSVIMADSDNPDAAWTFLKWWTSTQTQNTFGEQLEAIVGTSSRYNTANKQAIEQVRWDPDMRASMLYQVEELEEYPQVPGGYFTERLFNFAYRSIVYDDAEVRESMNEIATDINREMENKRIEFGLEQS